jgi:ankyrin repeat protein
MTMKHFSKYLLLASILCSPLAADAKPTIKPKLSKSQSAALAYEAFGAIYSDSDITEGEVDAEVLRALRAGLSPDARNEWGETLLLQAIIDDRPSTVRLLIARGANVNLPSAREGNTPLMRAVSGDGMWAIGEKPQPEMTRLLLSKGARPNLRNRQGQTALMLARGAEVVRLLLARGASVNAQDWRGDTALTLATLVGDGAKGRILLKAGANFRLRNRKGQTALNLTLAPLRVSYGDMDMLQPKITAQQLAHVQQNQAKYPARNALEEKLYEAIRGRAQIRRLLLATGTEQ